MHVFDNISTKKSSHSFASALLKMNTSKQNKKTKKC